MKDRIHITYNETLDPLEVIGIVYLVKNGVRYEAGRLQIKKTEWTEFKRLAESLMTLAWGFN